MTNRTMRNLIFSLLMLFSFSAIAGSGLKNISPEQLQDMLDQGVVAFDIRTPKEWQQTGIIPGSIPLMFFDQRGKYDLETWLKTFREKVTDDQQTFVLICRSGNRTGRLGNFLADKLNMEGVHHLQGGISTWIRQQRPVTSP